MNPQTLDTCILAEKVDTNIMSSAKITKAQMVALSIIDTYEQLKKLPNYQPGEEINRLLGNLVHTCVQIHPPSVIQQVCSPSPQDNIAKYSDKTLLDPRIPRPPTNPSLPAHHLLRSRILSRKPLGPAHPRARRPRPRSRPQRSPNRFPLLPELHRPRAPRTLRHPRRHA